MVATILAVDGPRSAGKTTILARTQAELGSIGIEATLYKDGRPNEGIWDGLYRLANDWLYASNETVVLVDRFYLTEWVYSTAYGRDDDARLERLVARFDERMYAYDRLRYTVLIAPPQELYHRTLNRNDGKRKDIDILPEVAWHLWTLAVARSKFASLRMNATPEQSDRIVVDFVDWVVKMRTK